jgi:poly-gamma-glutamate synthesis protein (capsule biosynthesis protein)
MATIGAGANEQVARESVIIETNGVEIAFLAYVNVPVEVTGFDTQTWDAGPDTPGLSWASPEKIAEDVTLAQSVADVVVVLLHSGYEFVERPSPAQVEASKTAIDAGASLVIGHHSHLLQGVEFYNDGLIVYGLGNFAFEMEGGTDSAILDVWLDENGVRNLEYTPVIIGPGGQPTIASSAESNRILEQIYLLSDLLTIQ